MNENVILKYSLRTEDTGVLWKLLDENSVTVLRVRLLDSPLLRV